MNKILFKAIFPLASMFAVNMVFYDTAALAYEVLDTFSATATKSGGKVLSEAMNAEGQNLMAYSTQIVNDDYLIAKKVGILYTTNDDGSVGYLLRSDAPMGERITRTTVELRMTQVTFYDTNRDDIPIEILVTASRENALQRCHDIDTGGCGFHNDMVNSAFKKGFRVLLQATRAVLKGDAYYDGGKVTVMVRPKDGITSLGFTGIQGHQVIAGAYSETKITNKLRAYLKRKAEHAKP